MFGILILLTLIVYRLKVSMSLMYSWIVFFLFMPDGKFDKQTNMMHDYMDKNWTSNFNILTLPIERTIDFDLQKIS